MVADTLLARKIRVAVIVTGSAALERDDPLRRAPFYGIILPR